MKQNLIVCELPEIEHEVCEDVVKTFIKENMDIDKDVLFDRVHRPE